MDVEMPGINGFETCRRLRALRGYDWFPIIYLSSTSSDDYIVEGLEAGGDAYIAKPINARVLEAILRAMGRIAATKQALALANRELKKLVNLDGLTQVMNRRGFDDAVSRYWKQSQRDGRHLCCMLIDVDHFKQYNDVYGHLEGDTCLKKVAKELEAQAKRPLDILARYGGEEFAMLLPDTNMDGATIVAKNMMGGIESLALPHKGSKTAEYVTASVGLACSEGYESPANMIEAADKALYLAKKSGRNQFKSTHDL